MPIERKINLEEILDSQRLAISKLYLQGAVNMGRPHGNDYQKILNAMKEACRQALELAAENAELKCQLNSHPKGYPYSMVNTNGSIEIGDKWIVCNKQSIFNVINLIE